MFSYQSVGRHQSVPAVHPQPWFIPPRLLLLLLLLLLAVRK